MAGFFTSFGAGAIAGAIAKSSIAPLDRCKISFQVCLFVSCQVIAWSVIARVIYKYVMSKLPVNNVLTGWLLLLQINQEVYSTRAALNYLKNVYRTQGVLALWRGNSATMARILPYSSVQFSSHEQYKKMLGINNIQPGENVSVFFLAYSLNISGLIYFISGRTWRFGDLLRVPWPGLRVSL